MTDAGRLHHEAVNEFDVLSRGSLPARSQNATTFTLAYGLRKGVEVSVSAPLISIFNERGTVPRRPAGVGDTSFQIKYNFLREREGSRLPALTASFTVEVPAGSAEKGTGWGLFDYSLNGVVQKSVTGNTRVRANGGLVFAGKRRRARWACARAGWSSRAARRRCASSPGSSAWARR